MRVLLSGTFSTSNLTHLDILDSRAGGQEQEAGPTSQESVQSAAADGAAAAAKDRLSRAVRAGDPDADLVLQFHFNITSLLCVEGSPFRCQSKKLSAIRTYGNVILQAMVEPPQMSVNKKVSNSYHPEKFVEEIFL